MDAYEIEIRIAADDSANGLLKVLTAVFSFIALCLLLTLHFVWAGCFLLVALVTEYRVINRPQKTYKMPYEKRDTKAPQEPPG